MKILSLVYEYPPVGGGGATVARALNEALVQMGESVDVVTSAMPDLAREETVGGVHIHRAACWRRHRHYTTTLELATTLLPAYRLAAALIRKRRPDLIHVHFVFPSGILAYLLARRFGIPYVLTAHGSDIPGYNPDRFAIPHLVLRGLWRRIVRNAAAVTSPSDFLAGLIRRNLRVPIDIVPNGYSPENRPAAEKRNLVLVVSRLFPRKGVQHFIESVHKLQCDWEFVVAGDGPYMQTLRQMARNSHTSVRFVGFVDKNELHSLYQQARILVFPSIRENFPMVLLEAMDAGCAIITTDAEGCAEVVGSAGIVVKAGNPLEIRAALTRLMKDPQYRNEISSRALERVRLFRWEVIAQLYRAVFSRITKLPLTAPPPVPPAARAREPRARQRRLARERAS
jgi:L-malate glycosyltransferase